MLFFNELEKFGQAAALISGKDSIVSYKELVQRADQMAKKIGERNLIFLMCRNSEESVIGYVGCLRNGIVPIMLSENIDSEFLKILMDKYHPSHMWTPEDYISAKGTVVYQDKGYKLYRTDMEQDYVMNKELALLLPTSGSTGSPKFVRQSAKNIQSNTEAIAAYLEITANDRAITTLPMNYTYGLSIIHTHLYRGAAIILTEETLFHKSFWEILKESKATTFGGVPYTYEILKKLHFRQMELPCLRYITQAGGKLDENLIEEFNEICMEKGIRFIVMYGQTEATARMSYLPWEKAKEKAGSIGVAIPGGQFSLIDEDRNEVTEAGKIGELVYRGDNVTLGYAESRMDLRKGDENNGILYTGDMAQRDTDGFYYIVGRKKRFLKIFGNRVNLDEVENLLNRGGIENACSGQDDCLKIYITDLSQEKQVFDYLVHRMGISKGGFEVRVISDIPRSESGKILYLELEKNENE